jgi:hypothetical protein
MVIKDKGKATPSQVERLEKAHAARSERAALRRDIEPYMDALEATSVKPHGRRTVEYMNQRIEAINEELGSSPPPKPLTKVALLQEKLDLVRDLGEREKFTDVPIAELEEKFIKALPRYSEVTGITRQAWRMAGVPAKVLKAAYNGQGGDDQED